MELAAFFTQNPAGALALSGGTDSAYLAWAAARYGASWRAYCVQTAFQPAFEGRDAERLAAACGLPLTVLPLDILACREAAQNPPERCYFCKRAIFTAILRQAAADGYTLVIDGTNASDDAGDRPGMAALRELGVRSPLRECGLTKAEVRRRSREAELFTWGKPAYACLATRVPTGTEITAEALRAVEAAEDALAVMGFRDFRARLRPPGFLIQVTEAQMQLARERWAEIQARLGGAAVLDETPRQSSVEEETAWQTNTL